MPWLQPLWIGLATHLASAAAYPLAYWVRKCFLKEGEVESAGFGRRAALWLTGLLVPLIGMEALCEVGREPYSPVLGGEQARSFD